MFIQTNFNNIEGINIIASINLMGDTIKEHERFRICLDNSNEWQEVGANESSMLSESAIFKSLELNKIYTISAQHYINNKWVDIKPVNTLATSYTAAVVSPRRARGVDIEPPQKYMKFEKEKIELPTITEFRVTNKYEQFL